jgi:hypothetical protein
MVGDQGGSSDLPVDKRGKPALKMLSDQVSPMPVLDRIRSWSKERSLPGSDRVWLRIFVACLFHGARQMVFDYATQRPPLRSDSQDCF